eukprot:GFYU01000648.1.p1 GENE.GFYU01000648.1~~GFYU01000648.1.p1  ORF type:complete len:186 (-),score=47.69 GFYU01000648.1:427-984(-)
MITFRDFTPPPLEAYSVVGVPKAEFDKLGVALANANEWIKDSQVQVINVETITLPVMYGPKYEKLAKPQAKPSLECDFHTRFNFDNELFQLIRVWYRVPEAQEEAMREKIRAMGVTSVVAERISSPAMPVHQFQEIPLGQQGFGEQPVPPQAGIMSSMMKSIRNMTFSRPGISKGLLQDQGGADR